MAPQETGTTSCYTCRINTSLADRYGSLALFDIQFEEYSRSTGFQKEVSDPAPAIGSSRLPASCSSADLVVRFCSTVCSMHQGRRSLMPFLSLCWIIRAIYFEGHRQWQSSKRVTQKVFIFHFSVCMHSWRSWIHLGTRFAGWRLLVSYASFSFDRNKFLLSYWFVSSSYAVDSAMCSLDIVAAFQRMVVKYEGM